MIDTKDDHRRAMELADYAIAARRSGDKERAERLFLEAYHLEARAAATVIGSLDTEPTRSILLRSAATLAIDCGLLRDAEKLVGIALYGNPPPQITDELRDLMEQVNFRRHLSLRGLTLRPEEFQVSIAGSGIGYGIAPTESFVDRVEQTQALLLRTAEREQNRPYRDRGGPRRQVSERVELFMSAPRAGSFSVTFKVGAGDQLSFPGLSWVQNVIDELFVCLETFTRGDEAELRRRIPDDAYFRNFVGLARRVAPDGETVNFVGFTTRRGDRESTVALSTPRDQLPLMTPDFPQTEGLEGSETVEITGRLRHADSVRTGKDLIKIVTESGTPRSVLVPPGMMDDIVKPLWNEEVTITGRKHGRQITLLDIEPTKQEDHI